jgi:hypothetical protein
MEQKIKNKEAKIVIIKKEIVLRLINKLKIKIINKIKNKVKLENNYF